ncbi:MAG TPA: hypothetical protein VK387_02130 [Thermoleophilaceae bacterium]|nr:hypothetical protein [Thermoleophilaceae bacterium]
MVDRLLRGRAWVALIAGLLAGIVFLNVSLLELNSGIARTDKRAADLRRDNAALRMRVARLGASERIQRAAAAARGFVAARPGHVGYLKHRRGDAARAARALEDWWPPPPPRESAATAVTGGSASPAGAARTGATGATQPGAGTSGTGTGSPGANAPSTASEGARTPPTGAGAAGGAGTGPSGVP